MEVTKEKQVKYIVTCNNVFAKSVNLAKGDSFQYLYKNQGIEFLKDNYDIEHTLSFDDVVNDLIIICHNNGGMVIRVNNDISVSKPDLLMEYITQDIIIHLMKDRQLEVDDAMNLFYNSIVFTKLHDKETGLYLEGSLYVYDLLQNELRNGRLVQEEQ